MCNNQNSLHFVHLPYTGRCFARQVDCTCVECCCRFVRSRAACDPSQSKSERNIIRRNVGGRIIWIRGRECAPSRFLCEEGVTGSCVKKRKHRARYWPPPRVTAAIIQSEAVSAEKCFFFLPVLENQPRVVVEWENPSWRELSGCVTSKQLFLLL